MVFYVAETITKLHVRPQQGGRLKNTFEVVADSSAGNYSTSCPLLS